MTFKSFNAVLDLWASDSNLAADLHVPIGTVAQWRRRNRIPARHWPQLVMVGEKRGFQFSYADLARLAAARWRGPTLATPAFSAELPTDSQTARESE